MYKIVFSKKADRDIEEIQDYISQDNPEYGEQVVNKILLSVSNLTNFPNL